LLFLIHELSILFVIINRIVF